MKTIWKYITLENNRFEKKISIEMPKDAEILCIQRDEKTNIPCIWALVESGNEKEVRHFELFGTGSEIPQDMGIDRKYIGTYQYQRGEFVGHLFERIN